MDLSCRSNQPEVMDAPDLDPQIYQLCLADLAAVNRITLTHRNSLRYLAKATRGLPAGSRISILDVAYGQGDLLRRIASWAAHRGLAVQLTGIDMNPRSAGAALAATPPGMTIDYRTGDVFAYSPAAPFDYIVSSQFTHHLDAPDIVRLLRWMEENATRGWHINDLHRHPLAYYGFPLLARLLRWQRIVRHDGAISIARAFRRKDWQDMLREAGLEAKITWHLPFRYSVARLK